VLKGRVDEKQAADAVRDFLWCGKLIASVFKSQCKVTGCNLIYLPFWKIRAYVSGHVDGYVDEGEEVAYMVPARRYFSETLTWTGIATKASHTGVRFLRNTTGEDVYEVRIAGIGAESDDVR